MRPAIERKARMVEELKGKIAEYSGVMIADITGVTASMMSEIRKKLADRAVIKVYKNVILVRALENNPLSSFIEGHPSAIILTNEDVKSLYKEIAEVVTHAPLRPGKESPVDVVLQPGPVSAPVTALSELKAAGIPVKSVKGAVEVTEEYTVVRKGEIVTEEIAKALELMDIKPVEIRLRVLAAYQDGVLYDEYALALTPDMVREEVEKAFTHYLNLSLAMEYPTPHTLPVFLQRARAHALSLAVATGEITKDTLPILLAKAVQQAEALRRAVEGGGEEEVKEEKEEEQKEEKKEEEEGDLGLASLFG